MNRLALSVMTLITTLSSATCLTPVAYAQATTKEEVTSDCAGAGCMGKDDQVGKRSSGLSSPSCVGAECMGN
jgi:hypothetical protein